MSLHPLRAAAGCAAALMFCAPGLASAEPGSGAPALLPPVDYLDIERYTGTWQQIAAIPQPFNLDCARNTQANYELIDERNIRVQNSCETVTGSTNEIVGNARVNDAQTQAQLHVSFPGVPFQDSLDGPTNYVVTYIADDYSWALVGDPLRTSGFVLSRSGEVSGGDWDIVRGVINSRGYDDCFFFTSPTEGGAGDIRPLCVL